jgi:hypothetical protein
MLFTPSEGITKWSLGMAVRGKKMHPALKHAGYSAATLLPGEDRAAFENLHKQLTAEFQPIGALEDDVVASMARYLWRKTNLQTFRLAALARHHFERLHDQGHRELFQSDPAEEEFRAAQASAIKQVNRQARKELGETYELVEVGDTATAGELNEILAVEEYLDSLIDKCIKRLLHIRGLKSLSSGPSSTRPEFSPQSPKEMACGPGDSLAQMGTGTQP